MSLVQIEARFVCVANDPENKGKSITVAPGQRAWVLEADAEVFIKAAAARLVVEDALEPVNGKPKRRKASRLAGLQPDPNSPENMTPQFTADNVGGPDNAPKSRDALAML